MLGGGIIYHVCAIIILVIVGRDVEENLREKRRTEAMIGIGAMGLVVVLWALFGFGLIWRILT